MTRRIFSLGIFISFLAMGLSSQAEVVEVRPQFIKINGLVGVEYWSGKTLVGKSSDAAPAGVELLLPGAMHLL